MDIQKYLELIQKTYSDFLLDIEQKLDLADLKIKYQGRKSEFISLVKQIGQIEPEYRKEAGEKVNNLRRDIESRISELENDSQNKTPDMEIDVTMPGIKPGIGHLNLTTQAIDEISYIFEKIGFNRVRHPIVDWDYYAFEALNFPQGHSARDEWETFFIDSEEKSDSKLGRRLITPHTSSGQVREMEKGVLPIRMININRIGRRETSVRHLMMPFQFEGMVVDKNVTLAQLKGVIVHFVNEFFGEDREIRIRPYDFRFTEPSFEIDVSVPAGSSIGKNGWLEIGGAGMIHPNVLVAGGIDPAIYSGFAFGFGVERNKVMQKDVALDDLRIIYQNDIRFLQQF